MITVGLDLSLTKTGFTILNSDGTVLETGLIKSKPLGDSPLHETKRIVKIAEDTVQKIDELLVDEDPAIIAIEGLAFMARNTSALVQLSGLNYLVRVLLAEFQWPFIIVAPTSLKKFITQKGNADKNQMMMQVFKDYGFESLDDNTCDSFALALCGLAVLDNPLKELTKPQKEVISLLKNQL